jgi:broad specificity phosphatase PhoE
MHSGRLIAKAVSPLVVGGLPLISSTLLVDMDLGAWDGLTVEEIQALWGHEAFERCSREDNYGRDVLGGEGIGTVRSRSLAMRDAVLQGTRPGTASILCTHKWVVRQILAEALAQVEDHGSKIPVPTASISIVDYPDGTWPLDMTIALEARGAFFPSESSVPLVRVVGYKPELST